MGLAAVVWWHVRKVRGAGGGMDYPCVPLAAYISSICTSGNTLLGNTGWGTTGPRPRSRRWLERPILIRLEVSPPGHHYVRANMCFHLQLPHAWLLTTRSDTLHRAAQPFINFAQPDNFVRLPVGAELWKARYHLGGWQVFHVTLTHRHHRPPVIGEWPVA